jgi:hypothetical protein
MQTRKLTETFNFKQLQQRMGTQGEQWLLIGGISPRGSLWMATSEQAFRPMAGWVMLYFAPAQPPALAESTGAESAPVTAPPASA